MRKVDLIKKLIEDIRSLKIQSATTIAEVSLSVIKKEILMEKIKSMVDLEKIFTQIENARPTEPLVKNCLNYLRFQIQKNEIAKPISSLVYLDLLSSRLENAQEQIIENGSKLIKSSDNIFTHCHSTNIEAILKRAFKNGLSFYVYLSETRPKFQGRITAENLVNAGLKVVMVTDSLASFLISKEDKIKIDLILLGCDAIFPDGSCYNKVGSYGITLSAKGAKIPAYIAGSLLKYSQELLPLEERPETEVWENNPKKNLQILNPAFDKIPASFIEGYITEFGIVKPEKIQTLVKKNYPWIIDRDQRSEIRNQKNIKAEKLSYLHLSEKINKERNIIATFRLETEGKIKEAACELAAESSIGTWTEVTTETKEIFQKLAAKVFELDKKERLVKVAYPLELFEPGNIPQLLSSVAGNIFGMKKIKWLRLEDLDFPRSYVLSFPGPAIGAEKIRERTGVTNQPLIGCIVKPKMGLSWREHCRVTLEVFEAGASLVKDDENLTDQEFNPFEKRVIEICKMMKQMGNTKTENRRKNKEEKIYAFNVTSEANEMVERSKFVKENGGNCVMVDILTCGFSAVSFLRNRNFGLIIHGHRAMHGVLTKNPKHGISMLVLAKLARLAGIDQLHTGTMVGKMEGLKDEIIKINQFLLSDWYGLKKILPIASGGLHPLLIPDLINLLGDKIILNFGGGIHGHPLGSATGVMAVKQAIEAVKQGIKLETYAKNHLELRIAMERWGHQ